MATRCRLIIDPPAAGPWNMAVDEVLLRTAAESSLATLRFYQWSEATLSLGYFQAHSDRDRHPPSLACPAVRRLSGGGAILHDRELTYSLALPTMHPLAADPSQLYDLIHGALVRALTKCVGSNLEFAERRCGADVTSTSDGPEPFLCFQRLEGVTLADRTAARQVKIAGSAQRRRQSAILQHGSVLLSMSSFAPELPGVGDLAGVTPEVNALTEYWKRDLGDDLCLEPQSDILTDTEAKLAKQLTIDKFRSRFWTNRR